MLKFSLNFLNNKMLRDLIRSLNKGSKGVDIFTHPISENVEYAKVWTKKKVENAVFPAPWNIYLIKNPENLYVGAVGDFDLSLEYYVLSDHRKMGYLTNALKDTILIHILQRRNWTTLKLTIKGRFYNEAERVAYTAGFNKVGTYTYELPPDHYKGFELPEVNLVPLSSAKKRVIKSKLELLAFKVFQVKTEIEMSQSEPQLIQELAEISNRLKNIKWGQYEHQKKLQAY